MFPTRRSSYSKHYRMESYVCDELFGIATTQLPGDVNRAGIFGHSMGGHGALVLAQRHRARYQSVSAFAPIAAPVRCPWGEKAFRSEEHTSELQSIMRISYAVVCLKKKQQKSTHIENRISQKNHKNLTTNNIVTHHTSIK